ncbi:MAG: glycosyltransferase family 39 protein [Deltaproteobacteria bacterium]|nr:glycosyltransferase family 39 protein [Deltaproteobacteria bacterium]
MTNDPRRWQLPVIVALCTFWESLFLWKGSNLLDEGWALYSGMQLGMGRSLYDDISWVFPPGHALPAWIGHVLDPQGVLVPRLIYGLFVVALCVALYELGRRLSPPTWAFLGALLLSVAAPRSHMMHLLYGYRYMVFAVAVLLVFSRRLRRDEPWLMAVAGAITGLCLFVRVTPAFAVSCGIGVAVLVAPLSGRDRLRDWLTYAAGLLAVIVPVLCYFGYTVGLERLWLEVIARPMAMLQPLPVPDLIWPAAWTREAVTEAWRPLSLRLFLLMYASYVIHLTVRWVRAFRAGEKFEDTLLVATVVWGGVFFIRSFGRADEAHMDTTLPPICLLIGHGAGAVVRRVQARWAKTDEEAEAPTSPMRRWMPGLIAATIFTSWVLLTGSDLYPMPDRFKRVGLPYKVTSSVELIEAHTEFGDVILDLSAAPMFHALSGRPGPGRADIIMEGTFIDEAEELAFIELLNANPPAAVLWPIRHFDDMPSRAIEVVAPRVTAWARDRYVAIGRTDKFELRIPRERRRRPAPASAEPRT